MLKTVLLVAVCLSSVAHGLGDKVRSRTENRTMSNVDARETGLKLRTEKRGGSTPSNVDRVDIDVNLRSGRGQGSGDGVMRIEYKYQGKQGKQTKQGRQGSAAFRLRFLGIVEHESDAPYNFNETVLRRWPDDFLPPGSSRQDLWGQGFQLTHQPGTDNGRLSAYCNSSLLFPNATGNATQFRFGGHSFQHRSRFGDVWVEPSDFYFDMEVVDWPWNSSNSRLSFMFKMESKFAYQKGRDPDSSSDNAFVGAGPQAAIEDDDGEDVRPAFFWSPNAFSFDGQKHALAHSNLQNATGEVEELDALLFQFAFTAGPRGPVQRMYCDPSMTSFFSEEVESTGATSTPEGTEGSAAAGLWSLGAWVAAVAMFVWM